jgi:hypothetical protein
VISRALSVSNLLDLALLIVLSAVCIALGGMIRAASRTFFYGKLAPAGYDGLYLLARSKVRVRE